MQSYASPPHTQKKDAPAAASIYDSSSQGEALQRKAELANNTGMPDNLKSGIESLSGFSMDDVRVHYNSSKPATVQALAYTQGTDIHVAPGQEKCLPHEAWHVAQQMAGRVSPTTNINGMPVNDNAALEHEADVMGEKATKQRKPVLDNTAQHTKQLLQKNTKNQNNSTCQQSKINYTTQSINFKNVYTNQTESDYVGNEVHAELRHNESLTGSAPSLNVHKNLMSSIIKTQQARYVRGHLLNDHLGGIGEWYNLFPLSSTANHLHLMTAEAMAKGGLKNNYNVIYNVKTQNITNDVSTDPQVTFKCDVLWKNDLEQDVLKYSVDVKSGPKGKGGYENEQFDKPFTFDRYAFSLNRNSRFANTAKGKGESPETKNSRLISSVNGLQGSDCDGNFKRLYVSQQIDDYYDYLADAIDIVHDFYFEQGLDISSDLNEVTDFIKLNDVISKHKQYGTPLEKNKINIGGELVIIYE